MKTLKKLLDIKSIDKIQLTALILIFSAIIFGFFTRIITVFEYITFDIGPDPDQIWMSHLFMDMWQGKFPHLGLSGHGGKYFSGPPLYYYLVFPLTILGPDPAFQALGNGIFSFLSILLLMYLVYQLLENVEFSKRFFLSGLTGFWYSAIYTEYFINNFSWSPSPIPFFLLFFTLLYKYQLETKTTLFYQAISWTLYGIVLAILVSLHATTLLIMPIVFVSSSLWFVFRNRRNFKKCTLPFLSIISANIALFPYWKLEIARDFANTREILSTILNNNSTSNQSYSLLNRLLKLLFDYVYLGNQVYFISERESLFNLFISIIFTSVSLYVVIFKFKGNRTILAFFVTTWVVFLYAASNFQEEYFISYRKILIWFAPILLAILSLAYLNFADKKEKIIVLLLGILIFYSISTNLHFDYRYIASKYSSERLLSVSDIVSIFKEIPAKSTICYPNKKEKRKDRDNQYDYIDTYITKKEFTITNNCQAGNYILHPKFTMDIRLDDLFPVFALYKTQMFDQKASLFLETPEAYVYILKSES